MSRIGLFKTSVPDANNSFTLQNVMQGVRFVMTFKGRTLTNGAETTGTTSNVIDDWRTAFNGKLNIEFIQNGAENISLANSELFVDVVEYMSAHSSGVTIDVVAEGVTENDYIAYVDYYFASDGSIPLDTDTSIKIDFDAFTNPDVTGGGATTGGEIGIWPIDSPRWGTHLMKIERIAVPADTNQNVNVAGYATIGVPVEVDKLTLTGLNGTTTEITGDTINQYAATSTRPHFNVLGRIQHAHKWVVVPVLEYTQGNIELESGNRAFKLTPIVFTS